MHAAARPRLDAVRQLAAGPRGRAARQGHAAVGWRPEAATAGAYLGGHLALRLGAGASHAEPIGHLAELGWNDLCPLDELPEGRPVRRQLGYLSLLTVRGGTEVRVLSDHCAHLGGPLHQGRLTSVDGAPAWSARGTARPSGSSDGAVLHGPATARQPAFDTRVSDSGTVQVRATARPKAAKSHRGSPPPDQGAPRLRRRRTELRRRARHLQGQAGDAAAAVGPRQRLWRVPGQRLRRVIARQLARAVRVASPR